jgi:hypothetical protein
MRTAPTMLILIASVVGCAGNMSGPTTSSELVQTSVRHNYQVCGERGFSPLDSNGGIQKVPHIAKFKQFMGKFAYAAIGGGGKVLGLVFSCPTSDPIAPVPKGYTPDWFGSWTLYCKRDDLCSSVSFANADLTGQIISNVWIASQTYYLYVYTSDSRQYIESYQIGPVTPGKHGGDSSIAFNSPFENGLTYPVDEGYALEIVHPSSGR